MTWVRLDDQFAFHPKMEAVGPVAGWLHVAALCHSAQYLLDGVIPKVKALKLGEIPKPKTHVARLLTEDVWHEAGHDCDVCPPCPPDAYLIHDYLHFQKSREEVLRDRAAAAERQRKARDRARESREESDGSNGVSHGSSHGVTGGVTHGGSHNGSHGPPDPTRPDPTRSKGISPESLALGMAIDGRDPRVVEAIVSLGSADHDERKSGGKVRHEDSHLRTCIETRATNDGAELDEIAAKYPDADVEFLLIELEDRRYLAS